jgi:hypothetical protein
MACTGRSDLQLRCTVTDWGEINNLAGYHRVAADQKAAAELSMRETTLDMSMVPDSTSFGDNVRDLVADGTLSEARIDIAAGRVLQLKKDVGLLADPYLRSSASNSIGSEVDRALSRDIARESLVLLKNTEPATDVGGWRFSSDPNWHAEYWTDTVISGPAAIQWDVNQNRHEKPLQLNWGDEGPATGNPSNKVDDFTVRFTATVEWTQGGFWKFTEHSDDLGSLQIDGVDVIAPYENNGGQHLDPRDGVMQIAPGQHELVYTFTEQAGAAYLSLEWVLQPTGSEGWSFADANGWAVSYSDELGPKTFYYLDGACSVPFGQVAPDCSHVCSQKRYGQVQGYLPIDCDFGDTGVFSDQDPADPADANPYPPISSTQGPAFTIGFETTIVTTEEQTWEFRAAASDDMVSLTIDGEVVWSATPGPKTECTDIYELQPDAPCNLVATRPQPLTVAHKSLIR